MWTVTTVTGQKRTTGGTGQGRCEYESAPYSHAYMGYDAASGRLRPIVSVLDSFLREKRSVFSRQRRNRWCRTCLTDRFPRTYRLVLVTSSWYPLRGTVFGTE